MHKIDLSKYEFRTDLIDEAINLENISNICENNVCIKRIKLDEKQASEINKKKGSYITISFEDITDFDNLENVKLVFEKELRNILKEEGIKEKDSILIIGLGNKNSTPDSLGPKVIENIIVTKHIKELNSLDDDFRSVSAFIPGVKGETGIETTDIIISLIEKVCPDAVIVIDALASQSLERLNKTIQITNTGITPGSGIGNHRREISIDTIRIPVIAIGVPTVVGASVIVADTINYIYKSYEFNLDFSKKPMSKFSCNNINYLKYETKENIENKKNLLGIIGTLKEEDLQKLISEVLTPIGYNLIVSPKEIDFLIDKMALLLANGINRALHKNIKKL